MNKLLEVKNLNKSFKGIPCLKDISFSVDRGDFLLIAGRNGSGKTVLMKHLNGLFPVKKETLYFNGEDQYKKERDLKSKVGLIFQNPDTQIVGLTVKDDISFGPRNLRLSNELVEKRVNNAMERLSISHLKDRNPHTLSGGEKKRVTIAGVLAMAPELIIFDEPFIGLDYPGVIDLTKTILGLKRDGESIIIITHDLEKVAAYCNRMIVLSNGRIEADGYINNYIESIEDWGIRRPVQKNIEEMTWLK